VPSEYSQTNSQKEGESKISQNKKLKTENENTIDCDDQTKIQMICDMMNQLESLCEKFSYLQTQRPAFNDTRKNSDNETTEIDSDNSNQLPTQITRLVEQTEQFINKVN